MKEIGVVNLDVNEWSLDRWLAIAGAIGTLVGISVSIWTWKKSHQEVFLQYKSAVYKLIGPYTEDSPFNVTDVELRVRYEGHEATQVSKIYLTIWNQGRKTLDSNAMKIDGEGLRVTLPDGCQFWGDPKILKQSRNSLGFRTSVDADSPQVAHLDFDFLDHLDGAIIEFLCTGSVGKYKVEGEYRGARPMKRRGPLALCADVSYRDRWIENAAMFMSDKNIPWKVFLPVMGILLLILYISISAISNMLTGLILIVGLIAFMPSISAIQRTVWRGSSSGLKGASLWGIPKSLKRIPIPRPMPRSRQKGVFGQFIEDLLVEVGKTR